MGHCDVPKWIFIIQIVHGWAKPPPIEGGYWNANNKGQTQHTMSIKTIFYRMAHLKEHRPQNDQHAQHRAIKTFA